MNPLITRLLPYAGWPLAALVFWFWLQGKEDLAAEVERCNSDKLLSKAQAEESVRNALQEAQQRHLQELERLAADGRAAVNASRAERDEALRRAAETQRIIDELTRSIEDEQDAPIAQICLRSDVPAAVLDSMR